MQDSPFFRGNVSINRDSKSPYWLVSFTLPNGKQYRRSTKVPVAGGTFEGVNLTPKMAERVAYRRGVEIASRVSEDIKPSNITVSDYATRFLQSCKSRLALNTFIKHSQVIKEFVSSLGKASTLPLSRITRAHVARYIDDIAFRSMYSTVKTKLTIVRIMFKQAIRDGIITVSPASFVSAPKIRGFQKNDKEAFTLDEVRYMVENFPPEWSSMVRCCIGTYGQRLSDIISLDWSQFDWLARTVTIRTNKTGRLLHQPMRDDFYQWAHDKWESLGKPRVGLLHPYIASISHPSVSFACLLRKHHLDRYSYAPNGRKRLTRSFHSLRATVATMLHVSGVPINIAMHLVGHNSSDIHSIYIRPSDDQIASFVDKLPKL